MLLTFFQTDVISLWKVQRRLQHCLCQTIPRDIREKIHSKELVNDLWAWWIIMVWKSVTHYLTAWKWHHIYKHGYTSVPMVLLKKGFYPSAHHPTTESFAKALYTVSDLASLRFVYGFHSYQQLQPIQTIKRSLPHACTVTLFRLIKAVWALKGSSLPKYVSAH